ncbi:hypothetical protein T484DRAFT_3390290 [Baffinella frigidus]|nr:hypothetical protein T484DRAFT_3390290 [Cryptophyta sp. CCMP2293]
MRIGGTPAFMPPEQFQGGKLTEACDLWSLGVALFMLLKNDLPFHLPKGAPNTFWSNVIGNPNEVRPPPRMGWRSGACEMFQQSLISSDSMRCDAIWHNASALRVALMHGRCGFEGSSPRGEPRKRRTGFRPDYGPLAAARCLCVCV